MLDRGSLLGVMVAFKGAGVTDGGGCEGSRCDGDDCLPAVV